MLSNRKTVENTIQFMGIAGSSRDCLEPIKRFLQFGDHITNAWLLSVRQENQGTHCFILTINTGEHVAIKSGFSSGYTGGGPHALSAALSLIEAHGAEIEEYDVAPAIIERIDACVLTHEDVERLAASHPVRPQRWDDYVWREDWETTQNGMIWQRHFHPVIPFAIVDPRLFDVAKSFFEAADDKLLLGYRRLEDIVRQRTRINEHGAGLFSKAFQGNPPKLTWKDCTGAEHIGRAQLFPAAYMAYRNPRAHRELKEDPSKALGEFLLLNHLFSLERDAIDGQTIEDRTES